MATTVERAMAKAAAALLPGLLPTPPRSTKVAPCVIILPADFPKPGRADSVKRWDAHKSRKIEPCSPASSHGSSPALASSQGSNSLSSSSSSSKSPGRAGCVDRWDAHKDKKLCDKWDNNKRPPSRASSARWDVHKKHRSTEVADSESRTDEQKIKHQQDNKTSTMIETTTRTTDHPLFSGSSFVISPDPSVLPMPAFFASPEPAMLHAPAFLVAH